MADLATVVKRALCMQPLRVTTILALCRISWCLNKLGSIVNCLLTNFGTWGYNSRLENRVNQQLSPSCSSGLGLFVKSYPNHMLHSIIKLCEHYWLHVKHRSSTTDTYYRPPIQLCILYYQPLSAEHIFRKPALNVDHPMHPLTIYLHKKFCSNVINHMWVIHNIKASVQTVYLSIQNEQKRWFSSWSWTTFSTQSSWSHQSCRQKIHSAPPPSMTSSCHDAKHTTSIRINVFVARFWIHTERKHLWHFWTRSCITVRIIYTFIW